MRADRLSHFRERLRQGADNFEFSALIDGVSTLDEPTPSDVPVAPFVAGLAAAVQDRPAPELLEEPEPPTLILLDDDREVELEILVESAQVSHETSMAVSGVSAV